jgi:hypothetical protein
MALKTKPAEDSSPQRPYVPTPAEHAALDRNAKRRAALGVQPRLKVVKQVGGKVDISVDHPDDATGQALFNESFGIGNAGAGAWVSELIAYLCIVDNQVNQNVLDRYLGLVQEFAPRDVTEAMLTSQMAAVHTLAMGAAATLHKNLTPDARDRAVNQITKLNRTFTTQVEALKRYRSKGEQKVVVEHQHVHVYPGGQAVVGTVNQGLGGGGEAKNGVQSHEPNDRLRLPEGATVLSVIEADQVPMPSAGDEGQERLQIPRRESRRAVGTR